MNEVNAPSEVPVEDCGNCSRALICVEDGDDPEAAFAAMPTRSVPRIVLSSDSPIVRNALRAMIDASASYRVHIATAHCTYALQRSAQSEADLVLLEFDLHGNCCEKLRTLLAAAAPVPVLILTAEPDLSVCRAAFEYGAKGLIVKTKWSKDLFAAIGRVLGGESWLNPDMLEKLLRDTAPKKCCSEDDQIAQLTKREREIIQAVARGRTNRQVADQLCISGATVRHHLCAIFAKLGIATRGELIVYAFRHRLADAPAPHQH